MATYPSSLTDTEWEILQPLLPHKADTMRGRPVENPRRAIIDGILYILRTGGAWRMMPNDLPHWKTCYHYFRLWAKLGHWERIHSTLRDMARLASGKKKPRLLRLSIVKAFGQLASQEFVVMMRVRRLQEENDMYW
jgi:putative transposase